MKRMMNEEEEEEDVWQNHIIFYFLFFINQSFRWKMATALKGKENKNHQLWHPTYLITLSRKYKLICFQKTKRNHHHFSQTTNISITCSADPKDASNDHFANRTISLPKMPAMSIHIAIERYLFQRCKQWPFILHSIDVSPKDASNDHSFCNRATMSLRRMQAMAIHFAIERCVSQRCKQWPFCYSTISLFQRSNQWPFCNRALSCAKTQTMTILPSSDLSPKDAKNLQ